MLLLSLCLCACFLREQASGVSVCLMMGLGCALGAVLFVACCCARSVLSQRGDSCFRKLHAFIVVVHKYYRTKTHIYRPYHAIIHVYKYDEPAMTRMQYSNILLYDISYIQYKYLLVVLVHKTTASV